MGPAEDVVKYHKRPLVESVFSFLKDQFGLRVNNVRGLLNVGVYVLLECALWCVESGGGGERGSSGEGVVADVLQYLSVFRGWLGGWGLLVGAGFRVLS